MSTDTRAALIARLELLTSYHTGRGEHNTAHALDAAARLLREDGERGGGIVWPRGYTFRIEAEVLEGVTVAASMLEQDPDGDWVVVRESNEEHATLDATLRALAGEAVERSGVPLPDYADERANPLDRWCSVERIRAMERVATTAAELFHDLDGTPADYSDQEVALMTALADLDIVESRDADTEPPAVSARTAPSRAALSALYLEAHRAGVEAAADWLRAHWWVHANSALMGARDELMAQAREHLTSDGAWTDPGSPLAAFSAARENGNESAPAAPETRPISDACGSCPDRSACADEGRCLNYITLPYPVHNHGPEEGPGLNCRAHRDERGRLVGECMRSDAADVLAKIEAAEAMVSALCQTRGTPGAREWTMSIPARPDHDPDLVIGDALHAARKLILSHPDAGSGARERVAKIAWDKSEEVYAERSRTAWEDADEDDRAEALEFADRILAALRGEEVGNG